MPFNAIRAFPVCAALVALALAALAMPAQAQLQARVLSAAPSYVTSLTTPLVGPAPRFVGRTWDGVVRNLRIEALPDSQGRMTFGVGSGSRCAYGAGDTDDRVVEFHNADGTWSRGEAIAEACPHWGPAKCSRTVTVTTARGSVTHTANAGYPPCPSSWNRFVPVPRVNEKGDEEGGIVNVPVGAPALGPAVGDARDGTRGVHKGIFRVRIWGNVCLGGGAICRSLKDGDTAAYVRNSEAVLRLGGYAATFRPASHCGPARWPSPALQAAGAPAYAEWCDVTVDVRR